jgi:hypothetical protein
MLSDASPTESRLILPEPFSKYCLTKYEDQDISDLREIIILPGIREGYGVSGPEHPELDGILEKTASYYKKDFAFPYIGKSSHLILYLDLIILIRYDV